MKILVKCIGLLVLSVNTYAQNTLEPFDYEKRQIYSGRVVQHNVDSLISFEKVVIGGYDSKVPFYRFRNQKNNGGDYVILLHGLGGSKEDWVYPSMPYLQWSKNLTAIKDSLLTSGFNIIIPDAKYHGERSYELNFRPAEQLPPMISQTREDAKTFQNMMLSTVRDIRIIMDYIEHETKGNRSTFSLVGYSMGGATAILLNASDNRLTSVVACVPPLNHPEKEMNKFNWPPKIEKALATVTPQNYSQLQQSPILLLLGKKDFFYTQKEVNTFYENVSIREKGMKYFDSGHELPKAFVNDVIKWIREYNN